MNNWINYIVLIICIGDLLYAMKTYEYIKYTMVKEFHSVFDELLDLNKNILESNENYSRIIDEVQKLNKEIIRINQELIDELRRREEENHD